MIAEDTPTVLQRLHREKGSKKIDHTCFIQYLRCQFANAVLPGVAPDAVYTKRAYFIQYRKCGRDTKDVLFCVPYSCLHHLSSRLE